MPDEKLTEEQIRHNIRRKFDFSETTDKERIDKAVEMEKDRFKAVQKKQELKKKLESGKPAGEKDPVGKMDYKDVRALQNVHDEDVDKVTEYAERYNLSIAEAVKDEDLKAILGRREEERKANEAVNTNKNRSGSSKIDGHKVLEQVSKNPDKELSDAEVDSAVDARWDIKHPKK